MKKRVAILVGFVAMAAAATCIAQEIRPEATEVWEPVPAHVTPGATASAPPSDAVVLNALSAWESANGGDARWRVRDGVITVAPGTGDISTREVFGDAQVHIEWRTPVLPARNTGQDRGNSGVFLQELYEVQILDTLTNTTYSNGQAGSIYKQHIPLVNAARPEGQWQSYDIIFTAPRFDDAGALVSPARMTVLLNGVLIQNNVTLSGGTTYIGPASYTAHGDGKLRLQDHGHEVSFRNIWVRRL